MRDAERLLARLASLEAENRALRQRLDALESERVAEGSARDVAGQVEAPAASLSRRSLLQRAGTGAAMLGIGAVGASLATLGTAPVAHADGEAITVGGSFTDATALTSIRNHVNDADVLFAASSAAGIGVHGYSASNSGVTGETLSGIGVHGVTLGDGVGFGVRGDSTANIGVLGASDSGLGVQGVSTSGEGVEGGSKTGDGVHGFSDSGDGVSGFSRGSSAQGVFGASASTSGGTGVWGEASSPDGVGVRGRARDSAATSGRFGTGIVGSSGTDAAPPAARANTGVLGVGVHGRGGVFAGDLAQVQLSPSSASSHPSSGTRGDLFVDKSGRLWFCKGGSTWKQLA